MTVLFLLQGSALLFNLWIYIVAASATNLFGAGFIGGIMFMEAVYAVVRKG